MYNYTVTVFNQKDGLWYPHVLTGVHLDRDRGSLLKRYGPKCSDRATLIVNVSEADGQLTAGDLPWYPPKQWEQQDPEETLTFAVGDFFMEGVWDGTEPIADSEYVDRRDDGFAAYLVRTRDYVFRVTSVSGPYHVLPHLEVTGA